jgi:hypothetical protein
LKVSGNTTLKQYLRLLTLAKSLPELDIAPKFTFWHWGVRWRFPASLKELKFYDFQVAHNYSQILNSIHMLQVVKNCKAQKLRQRLLLRAISKMPIKKILPIILSYQKELTNIAKWFEEQNELITKSETMKYDFQEFGYSTISYLLAKGDRRVAREFIDQQDTFYVMAEYRRELKNIENQNDKFNRIKNDSNYKNNH